MSKEKNKDLMDLIAAADNAAPQYLPEHELVAEIIKRAVWDALGHFREGRDEGQLHKKRISCDAQEWLWSWSEHSWSYRWCCEQIGTDADMLLKQLEVKMLLGQTVVELREPAHLIQRVRARLEERKNELYQSGYNPDVSTDITSGVWRKLFPGASARGEWDTWPDD